MSNFIFVSLGRLLAVASTCLGDRTSTLYSCNRAFLFPCCVSQVSVCLPPFLQKEAAHRPGIESFQVVMGNLAREAKQKESEVEALSKWWESPALLDNRDEYDDYCFFY